MSNQKTNPKAEWGFYAMTPRIIRTQYKQLSHTEKWLYVCLKDLCGDKGMCYRTLRVLEEETGLSTGNLSTGIRHLHDAGLIHAEKKRRSASPTAKEVWHISIVDIWQSNVEYCSKYEHSQEDVHILNNNVQNMNNPPAQRSNPEQQRSNFDDRRITTKNNSNEERTIEEENTNASATATAAPTPFSQQSQEIEEIHRADTAPKASVAAQEDVPPDENNSHSHSGVTQANSVGVVPSGRAKAVPADEQKTPPVPQPSPPVLKEEQAKQSNLLTVPLSEPRMTGPWDDEKCVQYAEWHKKRRYTDKMRPGQVQAAHLLSKEDSQLTLEQFKLAFDDWYPWWTENRGPLNVSDLRVKQKNGVQRYQTALDRLEMQGNKARQQPQRPQPQMPKRMPTREELRKEPV